MGREAGSGAAAVSFRRGNLDDARAIYEVFVRTTADLERRMRVPDASNIWLDPAFVASFWERRRALFEHLTRTAEHLWVAEQDGGIVGYARTTFHGGLRELTEFFVLPEHQASGIGRELLARAFPAEGATRRAIIATTDVRALARYLKAGVYPRFPVYYLERAPEPVEVATDLDFRQAVDTGAAMAAIREIDRALFGFARDADHAYLFTTRPPYLFYRGERLAGYGYFGSDAGPIGLLDATDFPAVLARGESEAAAAAATAFGMNVPLINRAAVDYLLGRGFRLEDFTVLFMSDEAFGRFDQYIFSSPSFFM